MRPTCIPSAIHAFLCVALAAATLTACGGGGANDSDDTQLTAMGGPVTIDSGNYVEVGARASRSQAGMVGLGTQGSRAVVPGANETSPPAAPRSVLAKSMSQLAAARPLVASARSGTVTVSCSGGGQFTAAWNLRMDGLLSVDDTVTLTYANCRDTNSGATSDGSLAVAFIRVGLGDFLRGGAYDVTLRISFNGWRSEHPIKGSDTARGTLTLISTRTALNVGRDSVSTSEFETSATRPVAERSLVTDAAGVVTHTAASESMTLDGTAAVDATTFRSVAVDTVMPFIRLRSDTYPSQGVATFTGARGSRVTMTALNATQVRFDLDRNGDGVIDESRTLNWVGVW